MLRNYLLVAWRTLRRNRAQAIVDVGGLSLALASCLLILLFVRHESSYDGFIGGEGRAYRVLRESVSDEGDRKLYSGQSGLLGPTLVEDFPEVERAFRYGSNPVEMWPIHDGRRHRLPIDSALKVEADFLELFDYEMVRGDRATALQTPYSVVLTEQTATRFFGDADPIGQKLTLDPSQASPPGTYTVTGVVRLPDRSSLRFDVLWPFRPFLNDIQDGLLEYHWTKWVATYKQLPIQTVVMLREGADPAALEAKLPAFVERHMGAEIAAHNTYRLQPVDRMHLHTEADFGQRPYDSADMRYGDIGRTRVFAAIGVLVLVIACVNFTNLATARASRRAREVGLRKVSGAHRVQLMRQYLTEAFLPCLASAVIAGALVTLVLPTFAAFVDRDLAGSVTTTDPFLLLAGAGIVALCAGLYPAFVLSSYEPHRVLKGRTQWGRGGVLRRVLVVTQFAISILLIVCATTVYRQLDYMQTKDLGFEPEHLVSLPLLQWGNPNVRQQRDLYAELRDTFGDHPGVADVSIYRTRMQWGGRLRQVETPSGTTYEMMSQEVDENFLRVFRVDLVEGRNFHRSTLSDDFSKYEILLNETAANILGRDDILGFQISSFMGWSGVGTVVGVVKDFHNRSLHEAVRPLILTNRSVGFENVAVRVHAGDLAPTLDHLRRVWERYQPTRPFEYEFVDQDLDALYRDDEKLGRVVGVFAALAILEACFGLLGLAAFATERRTKEVGVRKVLGASVPGIVWDLSSEFLRPVMWAILVAWPIALVATTQWLGGFAYRVEPAWWVFAASGIAAVLIALSTVSFHAVRASMANPVNALQAD